MIEKKISKALACEPEIFHNNQFIIIQLTADQWNMLNDVFKNCHLNDKLPYDDKLLYDNLYSEIFLQVNNQLKNLNYGRNSSLHSGQ